MTDILYNNSYSKLKQQKHHLVDRYTHCYKVMEKAVDLYGKYDQSIIIGALLHDFFFDYQHTSLRNHCKISLENSRKLFGDLINSEVEHIIATHMWPVSGSIPKTFKAWCVNFADKIVTFQGY